MNADEPLRHLADRYRHIPQNAAILAFEGPDRYSLVGGLGVRVTELARALGEAGVATQLFFIGDPAQPPVQEYARNVVLRRWCQWISRYHPGGVYDGEAGKMADFTQSAPRFIVSDLIEAAAERGEHTIVFAEDWQTAPAVIELDARLRHAGLRQWAILFWTANNTYGFHTIDWPALQRAAHIAAVSKYMKFELAQVDVDAMVIPNGIPARLLQRDDDAVAALHEALAGRNALLKVGRYDPDKRWLQAIDAVADLRDSGVSVQLIVRGGKEPYGNVVLARARERGLSVHDLSLAESTPVQLARALRPIDADVVNLKSFLPDPTLFALYGAVEATLANSGREPFGLVGLEVMASGGIPVCGSTGEDYAAPFENAVVCDTDDPGELAAYLRRLFEDSRLAQRIRENAEHTARRFVWPAVFDLLDVKLRYVNGTVRR